MEKKMNPVVWFEIPVKDLDRAKKFYEGVLDVKLSPNEMGPMKMAFFPMKDDAMGATGSLVKAPGHKPSDTGTAVYFFVDDIIATLDKIKSKGGKVVLPKTEIGEWGFMAEFTDTEGNRVALHSPK